MSVVLSYQRLEEVGWRTLASWALGVMGCLLRAEQGTRPSQSYFLLIIHNSFLLRSWNSEQLLSIKALSTCAQLCLILNDICSELLSTSYYTRIWYDMDCYILVSSPGFPPEEGYSSSGRKSGDMPTLLPFYVIDNIRNGFKEVRFYNETPSEI